MTAGKDGDKTNLSLHLLQDFLDGIAVGRGAEMLHYLPHGLHFVFKISKIDVLLDPTSYFRFRCHFGQIIFQDFNKPIIRLLTFLLYNFFFSFN